MSKTLKEICDIVGIRSSVGKQSAYFGGNDETLAYLANESVAEILQYPWEQLRTARTITMNTSTNYALPSDINFIVPDTMNADGQERYIKFPAADNIFWYHKTHSPSGIRYQIRMYQGELEVLNPDSGVDLRFEYITKNCIQADGALVAAKSEFSKDNDTWTLDDELLIKDLKWRYKKEKGIEGWEADKMIFNDYQKKLKAQHAGSRTIDFTGATTDVNPEPYTDLYV